MTRRYLTVDRNELLNLGRPPRTLPLLVRAEILFGGMLNRFGWLFLGFGMIFFWIFAMNADVASWYHFRGEPTTAGGVVTRSEKTSLSEGSDSSSTPVFANHYSFKTADGRTFEGVSYAVGRQLKARQKVTVEYPSARPEISRIRGMRRALLGPFGLITAILPLVGLCIVVWGLRRGGKACRLLVHGQMTKGVLKSKQATTTSIGNKTVYKMTFEFTADDGRTHEVLAKTHMAEKLEDDAEEALLYDSFNPSYAVMVDNLPGSPRIDEFGQVRAGSTRSALASLILPLASIIGHGAYAVIRFGG